VPSRIHVLQSAVRTRRSKFAKLLAFSQRGSPLTAIRFSALVPLVLLAGTSAASPDHPWDGVYAGINAGSARLHSCNSGKLTGAFSHSDCPSDNAFVGGVQIGDNVQYEHLMIGIGVDLDVENSKNSGFTLKYPGIVPPAGTYALSGKQSPSRFAVIAPRIGYASLQWLAFIRAGAVIAGGSRDNTLSYTVPAAKLPAAAFSGGKTFSSTGWAAGAGIEYGLNGPWSIAAEYLHTSLGSGSNSSASCNGTPTACAPFTGISFAAVHTSFSESVIRLGFSYWFGYWGP
jgi:opacity protein-like surface antigen